MPPSDAAAQAATAELEKQRRERSEGFNEMISSFLRMEGEIKTNRNNIATMKFSIASYINSFFHAGRDINGDPQHLGHHNYHPPKKYTKERIFLFNLHSILPNQSCE